MKELIFGTIKEGDLVFLEKNNKISENIYVILSNKKYCLLEELGLFVFENMKKPKTYIISDKDKFYKFGDAEHDLLEKYKLKLEERNEGK